jgi:hypothetical protein
MSFAAGDLLDALATELHAPSAEPSQAELMGLHRAIDERRRAPLATPTRRRPWMRSPVAIAATSVAMAFSGTATAFAAGAPMPRTVRTVAHDIGLPVDSPQLSAAKHAVTDLGVVLAGSDDGAIARARDELLRRLDAISPAERRGLALVTDPLLARAADRLRADGIAPLAGSGNPATGTSNDTGSGYGDDSPTPSSRSGSTVRGGDQPSDSGSVALGEPPANESAGRDEAPEDRSSGSASGSDRPADGSADTRPASIEHASPKASSPDAHGTQPQPENGTPAIVRVDL